MLFIYFLVLICWTRHGNDSADVVPCCMGGRLRNISWHDQHESIVSPLTISFYFCICRMIAQTLEKNVY